MALHLQREGVPGSTGGSPSNRGFIADIVIVCMSALFLVLKVYLHC